MNETKIAEDNGSSDKNDVIDYKHHSMAFFIAYGITLVLIIAFAIATLGTPGMFYIFLAPMYSAPLFIILLCLLAVQALRRFAERHTVLFAPLLICLFALSPILVTGVQRGFDNILKMDLSRLLKEDFVIGGAIFGLALAIAYPTILRIIKNKLLKSN